MRVLNYKCDFVWSDAKRIQLYDEEYLTKEDYESIIGEPAPDRNWVLERTEIYVPKKADALGGVKGALETKVINAADYVL